MSKLGLIAGGGALPVSVAARCEAEGRPVFLVRLAGFADVHLARYPGIDAGIAEFGKILSALKKAGCTGVCFAGTVSRPDFKTLKPDLKGAALLPGIIAAATKGDDALLRKILSVFEAEGYAIEGADDILGGETLPGGALGAVQPDNTQLADLRKALHVAEKAGNWTSARARWCATAWCWRSRPRRARTPCWRGSPVCPPTCAARLRLARVRWARRPSRSRTFGSICR